MALNSHGNISTHLLGDVFMNRVYRILLHFLTQQSSLLHSLSSFITSALFHLLLSFMWLLVCLCLLTEESSCFACSQRSAAAHFYTSKIISQRKGRNSELSLYSTRSLELMHKCAEWKEHSFRCCRVWLTGVEPASLTWNDPAFVNWGKWMSASNIHMGNEYQ